MEFRDLFNHVNDTKYDEYQTTEDIRERKITRNTNRKKHGLKESRMLKRTRLNEDSFETYYKKYRDKPMLRQSYENYAKDQYKSEIKPVSFRKWMKGLWEDDQKNESRKVHEQIRRRRKEKMKLREANIDEGTVKSVRGTKGIPGVKGSRGVRGVKGVQGIKGKKSMNEALKPESVVKIQGLIKAKGTWETARKLLDSAVNKVIGLGMDDLADTTIVANGMDTIESSLVAGNIQVAWDDAKAIAREMLEDEGMQFESKKMNENLKFKDGMEFDTSGDLRVEKRKDGYYVIGKGRLMAVDSKKEGEDYIKGKNESVKVKRIKEAILNEGMFSWKLPDGTPIYSSDRHKTTVYMLDDKGNKWKEDNYAGYGVFGGKDFFDVVAEMNGVSEVPKGTSKTNHTTDRSYELRDIGIDFYYDDKSQRSNAKVPRFTTDPNATYESLPDPEDDPNQGWFNDEMDSEDELELERENRWDDEDNNESVNEARSIGVKYKNQIKRLVKEAKAKDIVGKQAIMDYVMDALPQDAFDRWEGAYSEIERLCWDYTNESVNEDSLLTGGATVPNDPDFANPDLNSEPLVKKEEEAEMTDSPEEPKEDERDIPLEGDKEYLGNKGGEDYFYFVIIPAEDGTKDLQIQDAADDVVFSAKENEIDVSNTEDFLWKGIQELELSNISLEVVEKYLLPDEKEEDVEMEDVDKESTADIDSQQSRVRKDAASKQSLDDVKTPGGFIPKQGMGESKIGDKDVEKNVKEGQTMTMKNLLEKYGLVKEAFETKEEFINFIRTKIIPELEYKEAHDAVQAFEDAIVWMTGGTGDPAPAEQPVQPEKKYYNIDMDKLYKTGNVGEAKMREMFEKFGLVPDKIDILMEKYDLIDERSPRGIEDLDRMAKPDPSGGPSSDILVAPGEDGVASPEAPHVSADAEPAPEGGEPKAEDMSSPESAKANISMQYPEEPYTTTALSYADSLVDEPKVYGALRNLNWQGSYANSETFLKQAKIVGDYNEFNPDIAKRLVDAVGDGAKFRLAREGSVAVYFTIRDTDKKISLTTLKDIVRADEMEATGNPGEARVWWN